jgi:uncharacterized protein (DUF302 family)
MREKEQYHLKKHAFRSANCRLATLGVALLLMAAWIIPGLAMAQGGEQHQMVLVVKSNKSFPDTLKAFKEEVSKGGWSLLNANNMAGVLSERGFTLAPVVILDVCSGTYSARILSKDDYRPISAFMPCRVSIYQTSGGEVFLTRMNTGAFVRMMPPEVAEVMAASDKEIAKIIDRTVR